MLNMHGYGMRSHKYNKTRIKTTTVRATKKKTWNFSRDNLVLYAQIDIDCL